MHLVPSTPLLRKGIFQKTAKVSLVERDCLFRVCPASGQEYPLCFLNMEATFGFQAEVENRRNT